MTDPSARDVLSSLGTREAGALVDALVARGVEAVSEVLGALHEGARVGAEGANGRAVVEELGDCLYALAVAHPEAFMDGVDAHPDLVRRFAVLAAVGHCPSDRAVPVLLAALDQQRGSQRWLAVSALLRRGVPEVVPRLAGLLQDRDGLVVFEATRALLHHGTSAHLPALLALGTSEGPIGTRECALDAVEAICGREGLPLPEALPAPRLLDVPLPEGAALAVSEFQLVQAGERLARTADGEVVAPCLAVVVHVGPEGLVLRRREP